ncbi:MAG: glycosyltransferase [Chitinophagaceae bacterium]|nr:glycosyltransferase [Chitinophagaceae bacterium]
MSALSIIIPCYNEEQRLSLERLTSFLTTYSDTRLVLVNDGSTDNTAKCFLN